MATLTEVSFYTRRIIKWGALVFFLLLISPVLLKGAKSLYLILRPPPPPAPTVKYGKLPGLYFPPSEIQLPALRLETVDGKLPSLGNTGRVYFVQINKSRLLEIDRIKSKARVLGFTEEPIESADGKSFNFIHPTLPAQLEVNIISGGFKYTFDWNQDQTLYSGTSVPAAEQAILEAKSFLTNLGILSQDISEGKFKHTYYAATPPNMEPVTSLSEANFVRVDLYRSDKDKMPFVTTGGNKSPINITFSGSSDRNKRVVDFRYQYSKIIDDTFSTYPLKSVDQAWQELQQGQGFVAVTADESVTVRKIYLAYYESDEPQQFLQPIFVFEGDKGFMAFVSAVSPEYVETEPASGN